MLFEVQLWFLIFCFLPLRVFRCLCTPGWKFKVESRTMEFCGIPVWLGVNAWVERVEEEEEAFSEDLQ